ncbi:MAG: hypothetical protein NC121_14780 [Blautia sp.]|nr:hypothetical protein [Blautia sp.]
MVSRYVLRFRILGYRSHEPPALLVLRDFGQTIDYASDNSIHAKVIGDKEVEFEGKKWHLSPLTREIETRKGTVTASGAYQGSQYWALLGQSIWCWYHVDEAVMEKICDTCMIPICFETVNKA